MTQISVWPDFEVYDLEQALTRQVKPFLDEVVTQQVDLLTKHAHVAHVVRYFNAHSGTGKVWMPVR